MLEIAYLLIFYISAAYAGIAYFLSFFFENQISPLPFAVLMAIIVLIYFLGKGSYHRVNQNSFKKSFSNLLLMFFLPLVTITMLYKGENALPALSSATPYLIVFLTDSILLLQSLRHQAGTHDHKTFEKYQKRQTLAFFTFIFLGTVGRLFEVIMYLINTFIIKPAGYIIFAVMSAFSQGVEELPTEGTLTENPFTEAVKNEMEKAEFDKITLHDAMQSILADAPEETGPSRLTEILTIVVTIVVAILLVGLFILFIRNISKDKRKSLIIQEKREDSTEEYSTPTQLKKHFAPPDIQIRYYYKEFMKKSETEKQRLKDSDTTTDIMCKYLHKQSAKNDTAEPSSQQLDAAASLTDIYRKTRYSTQAVTKEDASNMKKLIKSC